MTIILIRQEEKQRYIRNPALVSVMEFIPLENYSENTQKKKSLEKRIGKKKKLEKDETNEKVMIKQIKAKPQERVFPKKNVKNKYRETLALKSKKKVSKKKTQKEEGKEKIETDESMHIEDEVEVENEENSEEEQESENNIEEEAFKRKCKEMDEKKKNRLFIKLKKKISSEGQIKEFHPDIRSVIFPRKKNSRWCWAVFASEERADEAFKQLIKNKDVFVAKPRPYIEVHRRLNEKRKIVLRKKEVKKKLQKMWM